MRRCARRRLASVSARRLRSPWRKRVAGLSATPRTHSCQRREKPLQRCRRAQRSRILGLHPEIGLLHDEDFGVCSIALRVDVSPMRSFACKPARRSHFEAGTNSIPALGFRAMHAQ